jgi:5-oxoprolinase (ATP-hydrolysing) subunit A
MKGRAIDLNSDMGESFGSWRMGQDDELMPHITSANIACGAHAGDPNVMRATIRLAKKHKVQIGAHPGFPDLQGFGRRPMQLAPDEIEASVLAQIGALWAIARSEGVELAHVKAHGALYNMAASDRLVALPIARAVAHFSREVYLYCLPGSQQEEVAHEYGIRTVAEGFIDRAYEPNGSLVDRNTPGAVVSDPAEGARHALALANGSISTRGNSVLRLKVRTLCIHGDNPNAAQIARAAFAALLLAGYTVQAPTHG